MSKKLRNKKNISSQTFHGTKQNTTPVSISNNTGIRKKDDVTDPSHYAHVRSELKVIGIFGSIIFSAIIALYFILR
jgi:hypothetical protein